MTKRRQKFNSLGLQLLIATNSKRKRFMLSRQDIEDLTDETLFYLRHLHRLGYYDEHKSKHKRRPKS